MDDNDKKIFKFGTVTGGKDSEDTDEKIPHYDYVVVDMDDNEFDVNGFLIFTPHHLAIMKDEGAGAVPALVLPIGRVKFSGLAAVIESSESELPF